jgi:hypothetical protein
MERLMLAVLCVGLVGVGLFAWGYSDERIAQCEGRGGVLVRSARLGYECVKPQ